MQKISLLLLSALLTACSSTIGQERNYHVEHYLDASTDNSIAQWRKARLIGRDALVAIYPDGHFEIVEAVTRTRYISPSMSPYVNDFVQCYLNMRGIYKATPVILQAPCDRDPERWRHHGFHGLMGSGFGFGGYHGVGVGIGGGHRNMGIGIGLGL